MGKTFFFGWETVFTEFLQKFESPFLNFSATAITFLGEELIMVAIIGFVYFCYDKERGKDVGINVICALAVAPMIKNLVARRRPYMDSERIKCLRPVDASGDINDIVTQGYSFPSMHSSNTFTVFGSIALYIKKRILYIIGAVLTVSVGLSRVYLGVHYITDVLAGWAIGALIMILLHFIRRRTKNTLILAAIFGLIALPGWFFCKSNDFYTSYGLLLGGLFAFRFEEKFVNFENTKVIYKKALRLIGALALFVLTEKALKIPFNKDFLAADGFLPHFVRAARYFLSSFVVIGVYPLVFKRKSEK